MVGISWGPGRLWREYNAQSTNWSYFSVCDVCDDIFRIPRISFWRATTPPWLLDESNASCEYAIQYICCLWVCVLTYFPLLTCSSILTKKELLGQQHDGMGNPVTLRYPRGPDSSMVEHLVQFQRGLGSSPGPVTFHAAIQQQQLKSSWHLSGLPWHTKHNRLLVMEYVAVFLTCKHQLDYCMYFTAMERCYSYRELKTRYNWSNWWPIYPVSLVSLEHETSGLELILFEVFFCLEAIAYFLELPAVITGILS